MKILDNYGDKVTVKHTSASDGTVYLSISSTSLGFNDAAFTPEDAETLAKALLKHARKARNA